MPTLTRKSYNRNGAIIPVFAFMLPVLLIFSGFAINLAYMQCVTTEMKIATDAAAHAAGRAMSIHQTTDDAIAQAELILQQNDVNGYIFSVTNANGADDQVDVVFGTSIRANNGQGMYGFAEVSKANVDNGSERATSVGVVSNANFPMVFNAMSQASFQPFRRSIATQVDRDIALVLDRSGSMLYYQDEEALLDLIDDLYETYEQITEPDRYKYPYWKWSNRKGWRWKGWHFPEDADSSWVRGSGSIFVPGGTTNGDRLISWSEREDAKDFLYDRTVTNNVIYQVEKWNNPDHTLGDSFSSSEADQLTDPMAIYWYDWKYNDDQAARFSRWSYLVQGVDAFLDVLDITDQEERVSLVTFNSGATLDISLVDTYDSIRDEVVDIVPYGGTAIGTGMETGLPPIISGSAARAFAAKTIVVLTDGENNNGTDPVTAVNTIVASNHVTVHTVTFSEGADEEAMEDVAEAGGGRHYHANDGDVLVDIFEEIANNLPTILTE